MELQVQVQVESQGHDTQELALLLVMARGSTMHDLELNTFPMKGFQAEGGMSIWAGAGDTMRIRRVEGSKF
jgi:hypothetical protein